jgi:serine protease AprX
MKPTPRWWWTTVVPLIVSALAAVPSAAGQADEAVRSVVAAGRSARVIMQFASTAERDAAFHRLLDRGAAVRIGDTEAGPALVVFGTAAALSSEFPQATQVSLDAGVSVSAIRQPARSTWRRPRAAAASHVDGTRRGIAVAIVDSGIQPHADLPLSRIRAFKDFVAGHASPVDNCGHGTHVAGIVAGNGRSSNGLYAGIAPGVDIVALRVLGDDCTGNTSDVIDALEWIGRYHETYRIKVVNLSLGHAVLESIFTDPLVQAVERLSRKGVVVVTAAGNKGLNPATDLPGYGGVGVPCNAPSSICVGALDTLGSPELSDDRVSDASSRGPTRFDLLAKPDLVAPGVNIVSLAAPGSRLFTELEHLQVLDANGWPQYLMLSGTSMASPAVAAAAALMLQENHDLPANTLKLALQFTARLVPLSDVLTQGAGALNIAGALVMADAINPNARPGAAWIRHRITAANVDANQQFIPWSQRIIYGNRFMRPHYAQIHLLRWNDDVVWAYDAIAENIVWGNSADDNIVWGNEDNIVWGNFAAEETVWGAGETGEVHSADDNIVWGNGVARGDWAANVVSGFWDDSIVWGGITRGNMHNIVWGNTRSCEWGVGSCE